MKNSIYIAIYQSKEYSFSNWTDCQAFIKHKSNVIFKGFPSQTDAINYLENYRKLNSNQKVFDIDVYTDGSYSSKEEVGSWAWVAIKEEKVVSEGFGVIVEKNENHNIDGELYAVLEVCRWITKQNLDGVNLHFDYIGIEQWAKKQWRAKTPISQNYQEEVQPFLSNLNFIKVKGHSNNPWNDYVDDLAKKAFKSNF